MRMRGRSRLKWELKNSTDMRESASNGCEGCEFFLAAIKQFSDTYQLSGAFEAFVKRAEPILFVSSGADSYSLETIIGDHFNHVCIELCAADQDASNVFREGRRLIPQDPNSPEVFELARLWLARCTQHDHCEAQEETPLPTRLIEVPDNPELPLRIYVTQQDSHSKYMALSHY
ncbi:hypothetical protein PFICI_11941 [Pestalotiopsis fici W106-1]|uniref:Uncharacterized protein n=1 Tax=Pestalotiopsis fici (strain W106-1 / CGMCC3.15140) TaxID=1229662 RepID=W3WRU6_PESFW|nr:uncharacterized protein PFICI_11941 [Pestalotiopsis fici W106-1]ETS76554.1 hypothetical protein PFICI_11941 [Pestalotiopsis fici W106-1]